MADSTVSALTAATEIGDSDLFYMVTGGADRKVTGATVKSEVAGDKAVAPDATTEDNIPQWDADTGSLKDGLGVQATVRATGVAVDTAVPTEQAVREAVEAALSTIETGRWQEVGTSSYTATPASTSTITFSDTSGLRTGLPVRYTYGGATYYGVITAVSVDSLVTVAGAPMVVATDLTKLEVGPPEAVQVLTLFVDGTYGDAADTDLLANDMASPMKWMQGDAYLVAFSAIHGTADGTAQPKVNVQIDNSAVSTDDSNNGVQVGTSWVDNGAVEISAANYTATWGDEIEVACTVAGTDGDAEDLTVQCVFVMG